MPKRVSSKFSCAVLVVAVSSITGCAQPVRVSDSTRLKEDEGVIVYRMTCEEGVAWGEFFESGRSSQGYLAGFTRAGALLCQAGYQTQRLKAGRYFVGKIGYQTWIDLKEDDAMKFNVVAQRLNYIGDIYVSTEIQKRNSRRLTLISDPRVSDELEAAVAWLGAEQPRLRNGYEVIAALAEPRPRAPTYMMSDSSELPSETAKGAVTERTLILDLLVDADGKIKEGRVARSCGSPELDEKALSEALRSWKLKPATENGVSVEKRANFAVTFRFID